MPRTKPHRMVHNETSQQIFDKKEKHQKALYAERDPCRYKTGAENEK